MYETFGLITLAIVVCFTGSSSAQTIPSGCTYSAGLYECDYATISKPISEATFASPPAQRLRLVFTASSTSLTTAIFDSDWSSITTSNFDTNYAALLEMKCDNGVSLTFVSGVLANVAHVQHFRIINCGLGAIPYGAFDGLGDLDLFSIDNGTITSIDTGALAGINITRQLSASPTYPIKKGEFSIRHTTVTNGIPVGLFIDQYALYSALLDDVGMTTMDFRLFSYTPGLRLISLNENSMSTLPANLFNDLNQLSEVRLYGTSFECSCENLWFVKLAIEDYFTISGDYVCSSPTAYENTKAMVYYYENCVPVVPSCADGTELLGDCMTALQLSIYSVAIASFILAWVVFGLSVHTLRTKGGAPAAAKKRGRPGPRGAKTRPEVSSGPSKMAWGQK